MILELNTESIIICNDKAEMETTNLFINKLENEKSI